MRIVKKMKKVLIVLSLLFIPSFVFCSNVRISLPSKSLNEQPVLPVDSNMGQTVQTDDTIFHSFLSQAISSEFGYEWLETYVLPDSRASIAEVFSTFLSENLPARNFVMSALSQNGDGSVSISVRFGSKIASFVVDGSFIVALSIKNNP